MSTGPQTAPPPAPPEESSSRERRVVYIVIGVALVVLAVVGLVAYRGHSSSQAAEAKAEQLITAIDKAGYNPPSKDQVVGVLGDDGGATCADPGAALSKSVFRAALSNGAAGPGIRPIIADRSIIGGQLLIISIYCPDELPRFKNFVDAMKTDDVVKQ